MDLSEKLREQYPDAEELLDDKVPMPVIGEIKITAYIDSNHAYNKGVIEISSYGAEFMATKTAVEEKKHMIISYHMSHKAMAACIVHYSKTKGTWNFSNVLTKPQARK
eukprot:7564215-Ditylum_brightwellii.AAC.1